MSCMKKYTEMTLGSLKIEWLIQDTLLPLCVSDYIDSAGNMVID